MKKKLGTMLAETMLKQNVNQADLCAGLCSTTAFSRYIRGDRHMDRLMLTVILQRLGKSADKFTTLLSHEEYVYFAWKQKVYVAQLHKEWEKVKELLQQKEALDRNSNEVLQEQFYLLMQAVTEEKLCHNREKSVRLLARAIELTVPDFINRLDSQLLLGVQEWSAILFWQNLQPDKKLSMRILGKLVNYTETHFEDLQEKSKIYPKVAAQYLPFLYEEEKYLECLTLAQNALNIMTSTGFTSGIEMVLSFYINAAEKLGLTEMARKPKKQFAAWRELMQEMNITAEETEMDFCQPDVSQDIALLHEMICRKRKIQGFTQEELSENICEPESLSRIETGKRTPSQKTYEAIAERLSLPEERYFSAIETDDFEVLDRRWELEKMSMQRNWKEVEAQLEWLMGKLDLSVAQNLQYVEEIRYILEKGRGEITVEKRFNRLINILAKTILDVPDNMDVKNWPSQFWKRILSEREMSILLKVADAIWDSGHKEEAILLLKNMLKYYEESQIKPEFHYRIVILILERLSTYYGCLDDWDKQLVYSDKGIQIVAECVNRKAMGFFVNNKANALEHKGKKEASLHCYKLAFYLSDLLKSSNAIVSRRSYEKLIGKEILWY